MAIEAQPFTLTLTQAEAAGLLQNSGAGGAAQQALTYFQEQLTGGNLTVKLTDPQLGKLIRFMTQGPAAVQGVLKKAFQRPLKECLGKS